MTDLQLLRSFLAVAECGSITHAARRLYITRRPLFPAAAAFAELLRSQELCAGG